MSRNAAAGAGAARRRSFALDLSPLRESGPFRWLYAARVASLLVFGLQTVAMSLQAYEIGGSSLHVGLVNLVAGGSMTAALLVGGILADRGERRRLMLRARIVYVAAVLVLLANAAAPAPGLWPIYCAALIAGLAGGVSAPALMAATPALIGLDRLPAVGALNAIAMQVGAIAGPLLGGLLLQGPGPVACYGVVLTGTILTPVFLSRLPALPPPEAPSIGRVAALREGAAFVVRNRLVAGLLLIDVAAMALAMPFALLPAFADLLGDGAGTVGLLYAAPAVGAFVAAISSGWTRDLRRAGAALIAAVLTWSAAILGLALSGHLAAALLFLALAGFADTTSEILRVALLQRHTPDGLRGRVASLWMLQATASPAVGNAQLGALATALTPRAAVTIGALACAVATLAITAASPSLRRARLASPPP